MTPLFLVGWTELRMSSNRLSIRCIYPWVGIVIDGELSLLQHLLPADEEQFVVSHNVGCSFDCTNSRRI